MEQLQTVNGMRDILPPESAQWEWFEDKIRHLMARYAYRNIRTPILEHTSLFVRGLGEVTDVVEKEMYTFPMSKSSLSLRPENTAGVVRALSAQKSAFLRDGPKRVFYIGPMFRHERVQRGRQRQFHQFGAEAVGFTGPDTDAELILMMHAFWHELGIAEHVELEINSLGQPEERQKHREALITYLESHKSILDEDATRRMYTNPLRVLDTKNPAMQNLANQAPKLIDYLGAESRAHLDGVTAILDANGVKWRLNPRLVRGLDYYNLTVFEFVTTKLGAQGTICAGGRYDYLFEILGAKPTPAVGFAMGMERVLEMLREFGIENPSPRPNVYAVIPETSVLPVAIPLIEQLRQLGVAIQMHAMTEAGSYSKMKTQFAKANDSQADYALIFGKEEVQARQVAIKALRDGQGDQWIREIDQVQTWYAELLKSNPIA